MRGPLLALLLVPVACLAGSFPADITLEWTNTDQYTDLTPIESGDLTSVRIECFRHSDPVTPSFSATVPVTGEGLFQSETFTGAITQPGTYTCFGYSIVADLDESDASNSAVKKYIGKPFPPQTFTAN